ncbi:hypothetical protein O0I10_006727 [Lichtheimia ornata]|uniref:Uncharacterized protein n=1 Tax=Lichtheimia ornata TaxID=688661 RepID=A0AAD7V351_9FUNG|nr:uncharacterized protein O0I10_006727 [Lichtheimia ornata]KAJ8657661.1 hypothetical protein O0I10_006727 [Lichtheimia ornata]
MKDTTPSPDLLQGPTTIPVQECNNSKQIEAAIDIIQQSASQFYCALRDRAKLLATSAQFEAALRDAAAMQRIRPTSALGYLCEGDVYCQQGRAEDAVAIYTKGLDASSSSSSSSSDPHYHELQQQRIAAKTMSNNRINFISQLPIDVVSTYIIPRFMLTVLSSTGYCLCLHVSDPWQQRIPQHGSIFEVDYEIRTFRKGHEQLVRFALYFKLLDLILGSEANKSQLKGLAMVANTWTHTWMLATIHRSVSLQTCPNLIFLKSHNANAVIPSSIGSLQYPRLTHLGLHNFSEESIAKNNLVGVWSLFLVSFEISAMPKDSRISPLLSQQRPHLRTISVWP